MNEKGSIPPVSNVYRGHFYFEPHDPIYANHFPGYPVVPGSLIVQAFIQAAQAVDLDMNDRKLEQFRFKRFVPPGRYGFCLDYTDVHCLKCTLTDGPDVVAVGKLVVQLAIANKDHLAETGNPRDIPRKVP